jgi:hypothetical protein
VAARMPWKTARITVRAVAAALGALIVLAGCTGKPPTISRVFARAIYVHDTASGRNSETLGVFLVANDPEGLENLGAFYVINDDAELFWKVESGAWATSTAEGEKWIGSTSLFMPGSARLPAGPYRVVLQDVGGDIVPSEQPKQSTPPRASREESSRWRAPTQVLKCGHTAPTGGSSRRSRQEANHLPWKSGRSSAPRRP